MAHLTVSLDFNSLHRAFSARTGRILERAAFLMRAGESASSNPGLVPHGHGPTMPLQLPARPVETVRTEGARWLVECALRDCLEEVQVFLEEVRQLCAAVVLSTEGNVPASRLGEVVFKPGRKFDGKKFPAKVADLRGKYGDAILDERIEYILTLNAARNCLVHRRGVVGSRDCNEDGRLVVRWNTFELHARQATGQEGPVVPGDTVPGGTQLLLKQPVVERAYRIGDPVVFLADDLSGLWLTLHLFGVRTAKRIIDLAKSRGLVLQDSSPKGAKAAGSSGGEHDGTTNDEASSPSPTGSKPPSAV